MEGTRYRGLIAVTIRAVALPPPLEVTVDAPGNIRVGARASDSLRLYGAILRVLDAAKAAGDADVALVMH